MCPAAPRTRTSATFESTYTTCIYIYTSAIFDLDSFFVALLLTQREALFLLVMGSYLITQKAEDIKAWLFLTWDQATGTMGTMSHSWQLC